MKAGTEDAAGRDVADRPPRPDAGGLVISVTPAGAFAAAAVAVSTAALLFTLGRRCPWPPTTGAFDQPAVTAGTSDGLPTVAYDSLEVDPGAR